MTSPEQSPTEGESLITLLREELLKTQLIVLDLNDRVAERQTEKTDAVTLLAQAEVMLEAKLNEAAALGRQLSESAERFGNQLAAAEAQNQQRQETIQALSLQGEASRREISRLENIVQQRETELAQTRERLEATRDTLARTENALEVERRRLNKIFKSALWRMGRPWRALFGPKI
jgi:chromosome segregation ATPase